MANYVPWYGKKRATLARRERDLIRVLAQGGSDEDVVRAAEEVRAAQVRALMAVRAQIPPKDGPEEARFRRVDEEIAHWQSMPVAVIVEEYRRAAGREDAGGVQDPLLDNYDPNRPP